jgi:hypothetical protein
MPSIKISDRLGVGVDIAAEETANVWTPHSVPEINGQPVSTGNPLPVSDPNTVAALNGVLTFKPNVITITQTVVALTAADAQIVAANPNRKYLAILNIGTGLATLGFGGVAVAGQGYPLSAASVAGDQGGGIIFESSGVSQQAIHGICAANVTTSVVVLEGV